MNLYDRLFKVENPSAEEGDFKSYINEAMERLMYRGDFDGLLAIGCFCVRRGCVVFPRYVEPGQAATGAAPKKGGKATKAAG